MTDILEHVQTRFSERLGSKGVDILHLREQETHEFGVYVEDR